MFETTNQFLWQYHSKHGCFMALLTTYMFNQQLIFRNGLLADPTHVRCSPKVHIKVSMFIGCYISPFSHFRCVVKLKNLRNPPNYLSFLALSGTCRLPFFSDRFPSGQSSKKYFPRPRCRDLFSISDDSDPGWHAATVLLTLFNIYCGNLWYIIIEYCKPD